ncbi:SWF/SNF family helicase [Minicystis rosea]|nr:SWF/SNF family helicase [Minicystis rosea]
MPLAKRISKQFPAAVRARGLAYFRQRGVVRLLKGSDEILTADVIGTSTYRVALAAADGDAMRVFCTCPYFEDQGPCKHIFATVLAADASPFLDRLKLGKGPLTVDDASNEEDFADVTSTGPIPKPKKSVGARVAARPATRAERLTAAWDALARAETLTHTTPVRDVPPSRPTTEWQTVLASITGASGLPSKAPAQDIEVAYFIDVRRSRMSDGIALDITRRAPVTKHDHVPGFALYAMDDVMIAGLRDPEDRAILAAVLGARSMVDYGHAHPLSRRLSQFVLSPIAHAQLLQRMCGTGRCYIRRSSNEAALLRWDDGAPYRLVLHAEPERGRAAESAWEITGMLRRDGEEVPLAEADLVLDDGTIFVKNAVARFEDEGARAWIEPLRRLGSFRVTPSQRHAFLEQMVALPRTPKLDLPDGFHLDEVTVAPTARLHLHAPSPEAGARAPVFGALWLDYDGLLVSARRAGRAAFDAERWRAVRRDPEAERAARERLLALELRPIALRDAYIAPPDTELQIASAHLPAAVRALIAEGWVVEASGKIYRSAKAFDMRVSSGIDWFDLSASVDFGGASAELASLLEALHRGDTTVVLGDGSLGLLPEAWLARYGLLSRLGEREGERLRFRKSQLGVLDVLLADQTDVAVDAAFARARTELREAVAIAPADAPASFHGALRPYQREGLGWLLFLERFGFGGCLADDMGLGKTVQVLALLAARKAAQSKPPRGRKKLPAKAPKPTLVVAPRSLVFNWQNEAARFAPELRVLDYTGTARRSKDDGFAEHDLVLTTYGTLRRDIEALANVSFDYAILDEAQAIKNDRSDTAKAARLLRADHRLALSGTPVENHLGELWSIFEFLNPGILGRSSALGAASGRDVPPEAVSLLARALKPFILRRTKAQVAKDLPERLEETWMCELQGKQRTLYDELRKHYRASLGARVAKEGMARSKMHVLEALLRLRQVACHPGLVDEKRRKEKSAKLETLFAELPTLRENGQKALIFSQFTSLLAFVRERLDADGVPYEYLDGQTRDRQARVDRFQQDPSCPLFLISLKAGGLGLNLTAAEYVFLLDPWWNPAVEAQAIDRAHRIGQVKPVFAYRLIAKDTIEERIAELQQRKRKLAESVIEGDGGMLRELTAEDLDLLLS